MKAPFPYFGGKSKVAGLIWQALGQPKHYIEPFFGSGAVLLARPGFVPGMVETVNDKDGFVCNVWRALQQNPDEVAKWCDWPANHADLCARKKALIINESRLLENLISDEKWFDPVKAGYWVWASSCWIGSGLTKPCQGGGGVHSLGQIPDISRSGMGVRDPYNTVIYSNFRKLSERLRYVRVVCGDWERVCGGNWQNNFGDCGIFFDPPYSSAAGRDESIYQCEDLQVANKVRKWCIERGKMKDYKIVLSGYSGEHEELLKHNWTFETWKAGGGYGNQSENSKGRENCKKEILWFSPHCLKNQMSLFEK